MWLIIPLNSQTTLGANITRIDTSFNIVYTPVTVIVIFRLVEDYPRDQLGQDEPNLLNSVINDRVESMVCHLYYKATEIPINFYQSLSTCIHIPILPTRS